ncbi:hypothetical protein [Bacillus sp. FJAT-45350]|uniref:hypothetical protein n=1 Tax=Bacillus sp. FJAT-45350 TaxID=2011014 RepID=UPI00211B8C0C|nr:hypothetical protein [Bacillus sp. FJAT-45350]
MKNTNKYILLMTILPWLTFPLIGSKSLKKFLPGALFMCLYVFNEGRLGEKKKWWWFHFNVKPNVLGEIPLIIGPFFVGSLWILKYTFGKFKLYLLVNLLIDSVFTFFIMDWLKKIGYASLVRLTKVQLSVVFLIKSVLMYGFQALYDNTFRKEHKKSEL